MKNKKGFTLVELIVVIVILAVLVIMILPNVIGILTDTRKSTFESEVRQITKIAGPRWVKDTMINPETKIYSRINGVACSEELDLSGRKEFDYRIEIDSEGNLVSLLASDGRYQILYSGPTISLDSVNKENIFEINEVTSSNAINFSCENGVAVVTRDSSLTYQIKYNANGGSGTMNSTNCSYGSPCTLSSNTFSRPDTYGLNGNFYSFLGWSLSPSATTATYSNGDSVNDLTLNDSITLYAIWEKFITYNGNYQLIDDGNNNWRIKLLTSSELKLSKDTDVDVFLVGGGGGGSVTNASFLGAGGGGGGKTNTFMNISLNKNTSYTSYVGAGGESGRNGESTFFISTSYSADGGNTGLGTSGGSGGSGGAGGAGGYVGCSSYGGEDGSAGSDRASKDSQRKAGKAGAGQGSTTREFGLSTGTLYASGGSSGAGTGGRSEQDSSGCNGNGLEGISAGAGLGGGYVTSPDCLISPYNASPYDSARYCGRGGDAQANTGSGGGGGRGRTTTGSWTSGKGGSGIIVIRNHR